MNVDRRSEPRVSSSGSVRLRLTHPVPRFLVAGLVDISRQGFRIIHRDADLSVGDIVAFDHEADSGEAVVVWTRFLNGTLETGLSILRQNDGTRRDGVASLSTVRADPYRR